MRTKLSRAIQNSNYAQAELTMPKPPYHAQAKIGEIFNYIMKQLQKGSHIQNPTNQQMIICHMCIRRKRTSMIDHLG